MKRDIRLLVNLAVSDLGRNNTAQVDLLIVLLKLDLAIIGLKLEMLERRIADLWSYYEGFRESPSVKYPTTYSIKTEKERMEEAD